MKTMVSCLAASASPGSVSSIDTDNASRAAPRYNFLANRTIAPSPPCARRKLAWPPLVGQCGQREGALAALPCSDRALDRKKASFAQEKHPRHSANMLNIATRLGGDEPWQA